MTSLSAQTSNMDYILTPKVDNVRMIDRQNAKNVCVGCLYMTATHLIFVDPDVNKETWILYMHIASVEKLPLTTSGSPLLIRCKNFLTVTFSIAKERKCHDVYKALLKLCKPTNLKSLYCFRYVTTMSDLKHSAESKICNLEMDFDRMNIKNSAWVPSELNQNYELCKTYPRQIYVPAQVSTATLLGSSKFRAKGRLPVLTYLYKNGASICRCSQPLSGFNARCLDDELMFEAIRNTNSAFEYLYVVDTRPRINALANRAAGKGYENETFYEKIKFFFFGIENIHVMRTSLQKLTEGYDSGLSGMNSFYELLESAGWLKHIKSILETSAFISKSVKSGISVVVHCSDGWDRTAQVCSIASMMLDPFYRTLKGFQTLIEKDWLAFGHKFSERCGFVQADSKEISPVFSQFLDVTWQLVQYQSDAFEFNERFLLTLHDHVHSCQFGTFIGNSEKERVLLRVSESTYSLWDYININPKEFLNPSYKTLLGEDMLSNIPPQSIRFWRGMYSRFENDIHPREPPMELLLQSQSHVNSLKALVDELKELVKCPHGIESIKKNISVMAIEWTSTKNKNICQCTTQYDQYHTKQHCWICGDLYCSRCMKTIKMILGKSNENAMPICRSCFASIHSSI